MLERPFGPFWYQITSLLASGSDLRDSRSRISNGHQTSSRPRGKLGTYSTTAPNLYITQPPLRDLSSFDGVYACGYGGECQRTNLGVFVHQRR
jgi:hypothetical protein